MRPLDKGSCPQIDGKEIVVNNYAEWRRYLIERIGYYCAFCNIPLSHSLNVEHVIPKVAREGEQQGEMLKWENMLLACGPCNNKKSNRPVRQDELYLPEANNTLLAFKVVESQDNPDAAIVGPTDTLNDAQKKRARNTIELLGLNQIDRRNDIVDIRWKRRKAALLMARTTYDLYLDIKESLPGSLEKAATHIAKSAAEIGFFSVWFDTFRDEDIVIEKLKDNSIIPGTAQGCFSNNSNKLLPRNPKNENDPI